MSDNQDITTPSGVKRRHLVGGAALGVIAGAVSGLAGGGCLSKSRAASAALKTRW